MGSRATSYWRSMLMMMTMRSSSIGGGNQRRFVTSTSTRRMKPVADDQTPYFDHHHHHHYSQQQQQQQKQSSSKPPSPRGVRLRLRMRGEYVPVYVTVGLIVVAGLIGIHTANQHLKYDPAVRLRKKKRRETFPEVEEPEHVVEESHNLIKKSFFRKLAHLQEFDFAVPPDTIRRGDDVYTRPPKAETLKSVGVDPRAH